MKTKFNNGSTPLIVVYTGKDNHHRGNNHGRIGLGRVIAEKMNGEFIHFDQEILNGHFKNTKNIGKAIQEFMGNKGVPDMLISKDPLDFHVAEQFVSSQKNYMHPIKSGNVVNTFNYLKQAAPYKQELVQHHLSNSLLQEHGQTFKQHYPALTQPLIAVMIGPSTRSTDRLAQHLKRIAAAYDDKVTFGLCYHRNARLQHKQLAAALQTEDKSPITTFLKSIFNQNVPDTTTFTLIKQKPSYNPYLGLLDQADHIIVTGQSQSMLSEALFTGKQVHGFELHEPEPQAEQYSALYDKEWIKQLESHSHSILHSNSIPQINVTDDIASEIIDEYAQNRFDHYGFTND